MMLLGLAAPAFADDTQSQLDSMKAQIAKMETIINQNQKPQIGQAQDWFNRITISGLINADAYFADRTPNFKKTASNTAGVISGSETVDGATQNFALQNANIFAHAVVNDWTTADVSIMYQDNNANFVPRIGKKTDLDQAYVTIGNFAKSPVYFRAGKFFEAFGMYERFPLITNPTQLLSETKATTAQVGFVLPQGFYGSVAAFRGLPKASNGNVLTQNATTGDITGHSNLDNGRTRVQNGVANLGYMYATDNFGTKIDVGYIYNMADVNYMASSLPAYTKAFGGISASVDVRYNAFDAGLRYVGATQESQDLVGTNGHLGAKPKAFGIDAGYTFPVLAHSSRIGVGYQATKQAALVGGSSSFDFNGLPKNRWYADYMVNVSKWTDVGVAVYRDKDYAQSDLGTGNKATVGVLRLSVKIA